MDSILIVSEQGPAVQVMLQTASRQIKIDVDTDSDSLFALPEQQKYSLLIIDLAFLPDDSGTFFSRLNRHSPHPAVLLLAAPNRRQAAIRQLEYSTVDYLLTPVDEWELQIKVERLLELQALKSTPPPEAGSTELLALLQACGEISHSLQRDEVLKIILSMTQQLTQATLAKVYLADRAECLSRDQAVSLSPGQASKEDTLLFTLAQQVAQKREIIGHPPKASDEWQHQHLQSTLTIPLISHNKLIGVLVLGSRQANAFSDDQTRWLSIFCDRAAIAIENANLFEDLSSAYIDLAQSREEILHSRNTLQVLFEGITDDLYIVDRALTIQALNQPHSDQTVPESGTLVGQSYLSLDWARSAPQLLEQIKGVFKTGRESTWIPPKEEAQPYLKDREFRIYPIRNRLGQVEQAVIFAQDVSERRRLQASLFRSANLVAVGQLAGSVAHQINNPLTVAMANSQLILLEAPPGSETHELTTDTLKATERIQSIVRNLLEFSNQETYFFVETDLIATIEDALALVMRSLKKVNTQVEKNYRARPRLSASISHLKLVWMNLLLNARDAITGHGGQPQITIATAMISERKVKVTLADNGVGISEENQEQLFRPFFSTKPVGKGLGLGLYSVHNIVERHNGAIHVTSRPNEGTTFEITLPLDNPRDL